MILLSRLVPALPALVFVIAVGGCEGARPFIAASPNPVPSGAGPGRTTVIWSAGERRPVRVMLSVAGGPEILFAAAPSGRQDAPWIGNDAAYEFRLYDATTDVLLAAVTVRRDAGASWSRVSIVVAVLVVTATAWRLRRALRLRWHRLVTARSAATETVTRPRVRFFWPALAVLVIGTKAVLWSMDSVPRVFLGDSGVYLRTALVGGIPVDRSFTYGWAIAGLTGEGHDVGRLIIAQVVGSAAAALLLGIGLRAAFGASYGLVAAAVAAVTVEPLQLAYERFVMTETFAGLGYAALVVAGLAYLRRPRTAVLAAVAVLGVLVLSLRLSAMLMAVLCPLVLPLLAWRRLSCRRRSLRPWIHVAVGLGSVIVAHGAYRATFGRLVSTPPAYHYSAGRVLLTAVSPLVRAEDFPDAELARRVLHDVDVPLRLPREARYPLHVRDSHAWAAGGLVTAVHRHAGDVVSADALARRIALRTLARDPLGALTLGVLTLQSYFDPTLRRLYDPAAFAGLITPELGPDPVPAEAELGAYGIGPASAGPSVTRRWHAAAVGYYPLLVLCPLLALGAMVLSDRRGMAATLFLFVVSALLVVPGLVLANSTVIRYLHPLGWMSVFVVAVLAHHGATRWATAASRRPRLGHPDAGEIDVDGHARPALEGMVSVIMPCLDEAQAVGRCVEKARQALADIGIAAEIIVVDNGSTDGSADIAARAGARVVYEPHRGYGAAYLRGLREARGDYFVMGDADDSYDFSDIARFVEPLRNRRHDVVIGSRLKGHIEPGAMSWSHRWIGNPVLSGMLRLMFRTSISDSHCGMRSLTREAYQRMHLRTRGMEFASEMVVSALREGLRVGEVPITYAPRLGESKLVGLRDAWRHVRFMLVYSPSYLFRLPGVVLAVAGIGIMAWLARGPRELFGHQWDFHVLLFGALAVIVGYDLVLFDILAKMFSMGAGLARPGRWLGRLTRWFTLERGVVLGALLFVAGSAVECAIAIDWIRSGFGPLMAVRGIVVGMTAMVLGAQTVFASFLVSLVSIERGA